LGKREEALSAYGNAIAQSPFEAHLAIAGFHRVEGDTTARLHHLFAASEADTSRFEPWLDIAEIHEAQSAFADAASAYPEVKRRNPGLDGLLAKIGAAYAKSGKPAEAVSVYEEWVSRDPSSATALFNLAVTYDALGRHDKAIEKYREAIAIQVGFADAHLNLAIDLLDRKAFDEALDAYLAYLECAKPGQEAHTDRGDRRQAQDCARTLVNCYTENKKKESQS